MYQITDFRKEIKTFQNIFVEFNTVYEKLLTNKF